MQFCRFSNQMLFFVTHLVELCLLVSYGPHQLQLEVMELYLFLYLNCENSSRLLPVDKIIHA